jgi:Resolvase, N terminal domain.
LKAVAYCRYSSDNQREESIEAQVRAIEEYAEKTILKLLEYMRMKQSQQLLMIGRNFCK